MEKSVKKIANYNIHVIYREVNIYICIDYIVSYIIEHICSTKLSSCKIILRLIEFYIKTYVNIVCQLAINLCQFFFGSGGGIILTP